MSATRSDWAEGRGRRRAPSRLASRLLYSMLACLAAPQSVAWSDWTIARDSEVWSSSAGAFDPTRWLDRDGRFKKDPRMHSFNGGFRRQVPATAQFRCSELTKLTLRAFLCSLQLPR